MLSDYSNRFASQSLALAPLACLSLTASAGIPLQYPATQARFARRLVPGPFAPAVLRLAPGAALQDGRQLHEGRMEFAQAIPRQPLNFAARVAFSIIHSAFRLWEREINVGGSVLQLHDLYSACNGEIEADLTPHRKTAQPDGQRHGLGALSRGAARGVALAAVLIDLVWVPGSRLPTAQTLLDVEGHLLQLQRAQSILLHHQAQGFAHDLTGGGVEPRGDLGFHHRFELG